MEQLHELEFSNQQKIKASILKQEKYSSIIALIIFFTILIITHLFIATFSDMIRLYAILSITVLFLVIRLIVIWERATRRQKKKWMNHYGQQITAVVTGTKSSKIFLEWCDPQTGKIRHYKIVVPRSNYSDMVAEEQLPKRGLAMLLNVVPVFSGKLGLVCRSVLLFGNRENRKRFELDLAHRHETGSQFPLWIDPNDPDFYCPDNEAYWSVPRLVTRRFPPSPKRAID